MSFITQPPNLTTVSGTLASTNGGTGLTSPGANGNVLTSNGTTWTSAAPAGGSGFTLISTLTASSSATLDFTGLSGYNNYLLVYNGLGSTNSLGITVGTGATPTYLTSGWYTAYSFVQVSTTTYTVFQNTNSDKGFFTFNQNSTTLGASGFLYLNNMTNGRYVAYSSQNASDTNYPTGSATNITICSGYNADTTAKTAIRILRQGGGVIISGSVSLFGISS